MGYHGGRHRMKSLFAVVAICAAVIVAFEVNDESSEVARLQDVVEHPSMTSDISLPTLPAELVLLQDVEKDGLNVNFGGVTLTTTAADSTANATAAADETEAKTENIESTAETANDDAQKEENEIQGEEESAKKKADDLEHQEQQAQEQERREEE